MYQQLEARLYCTLSLSQIWGEINSRQSRVDVRSAASGQGKSSVVGYNLTASPGLGIKSSPNNQQLRVEQMRDSNGRPRARSPLAYAISKVWELLKHERGMKQMREKAWMNGDGMRAYYNFP